MFPTVQQCYTGSLTYLDIPGDPVGFYLFGGTSVGSPQWAAILAIADQKAGHDLGFINAGIYRIGQAAASYAASLHDVTSGNNSDMGIQGFNAGPGWDAVTGLGSPKADVLVSNLIQLVSAGDGVAAIATSSPHLLGKQSNPGHMNPN